MIPREVELSFLSNVPLIWWGAPGIGKTAVIRQLFKKHDVAAVTLIASTREPSDFSGMPLLNSVDGTYRLAPPSFVRFLQENARKGKRTAIFADELSTAPPTVQAALLRVFDERVIGEEELPADCWMAAAANPPEQAANGYELAPPLANRFSHLEINFNPRDFIMNFNSYWEDAPVLPGIDPIKWMKARGDIAAFLHVKVNSVHDFPKEESKRGRAWPSPRTWDKASRMLAVSNGIDDALTAVAGCVGSGIAGEFATFMKNLDLPDPEDLLKNPDKFNVTKYAKRGDQMFAVLSSVHAAVSMQNTEKRYRAAWKIVGAVSDAKLQDVACCWARPLAKIMPKGIVPPEEVLKFSKLMSASGIRHGG